MKKKCNILGLLMSVVLILVGCDKEPELFKGGDNGLTLFEVESSGVTYVAAISKGDIVLSVPYGVDLSQAVVKYKLCEHATIIPNPSEITNWNSDHVFRVKSYSASPQEYTYTVQRAEVLKVGNVHLLTQSDVDEFAKLGSTMIDGNLIIGSDTKPVKDSIVNLEALASLKEVRYNIIINRSFAGGSVKGLDNIEHCGGLFIGSVLTPTLFPAVTGIYLNLPNLQSAGDIVLNSSSLKNISMEELESVSSLLVSSNSLVALKLPQLKESVGGLNIDNNSNLVNSILSEIVLPSLEKVGGKFSMQWFSGVSEMKMPKLSSVGGDISVALNSGALEKLSFPELTIVGGAMIIERAPVLLSFDAPKLTSVDALHFNKASYGDYPTKNFNLPLLERVNGELYMRGAAIEKLSFPKLEKVEGELTFWDLKNLTDVDMPLVKTIGGRVQLYSIRMLETFNISTLDALSKLELIGCSSLKKVKTPTVVGDITLNYASSALCPTPHFEGLESIDGTLSFTNDYQTKLFTLNGVKKVGVLKFGGGAKDAVLSLGNVENITTLEISSSNIVEFDAPMLNYVENLKFSYISKLTTVKIPMLKELGSFTFMEHNQWGASSAVITNLDHYKGITTIGSVNISNCSKLVDFSALAVVAQSVDSDKWIVTSCGYNPTYENMVSGEYIKP